MAFLEDFFYSNKGPLIWKWKHYFDIYERYFSPYRGKEVVVVEIGVFQGGSLQMWKAYFGDKAKIYGIDIDPQCKKLEDENIEIFIGDQSDEAFLNSIVKQIPAIDILIDDGGHFVTHQVASLKVLYPHIKENGIYLCEDLHTSYWKEFGGAFKKNDSFIEYSKTIIDSIHAWHSKERKFDKDIYTTSAYALHYYDSVFVIEKRPIGPPVSLRTGKHQTSSDYSEDIMTYSKHEDEIHVDALAMNKGLRQLKAFVKKVIRRIT